MGYTTDFSGEFDITPPLEPEHRAYLEQFAKTRRVKRDASLTATRPDPLRIAAQLPVGLDGAYFVNEDGPYGQSTGDDVVDGNEPPGSISYRKPADMDIAEWMRGWNDRWEAQQERIAAGEQQPGLWCQWTPNETGTALIWDGGEKFYEYIPWLKYLIDHFFSRWGYTLDGVVYWEGEESDDRGRITVANNVITVAHAVIGYI